MGCTTCKERRLHKGINRRARLIHRYVSISEVVPILRKYGIEYQHARVGGIPYVKFCMCHLTRSLLKELQALKTKDKGLPVLYT